MAEHTGAESTATIAARCLDDADFARQVLEGEEYPDVRAAIIADLDDEQSVKGHLYSTGQNYINPQPLPPSPALFSSRAFRSNPALWTNWYSLDRRNLNNLALRR
jgi:hypothetical protein